jgi:catechol 1,2-dioxygenase
MTHIELTQSVLSVMAQTPDARLREIMQSLVAHLHGFITDVGLTEEEFRQATAVVARLGQLTHDTHNEVVLMAGSLGVSSLVCLLNNGRADRTGVGAGSSPGQGAQAVVETTQNLLGPFWRMHSPPTANGGSIVRSATPGPVMHVRAQILDMAGAPVAGALVDIWHCSHTGFYEHQPEGRAEGQADMNLRGQFTTDAQGRFDFWSVKPIGYSIPTDGVVGQLLQAQGRHSMRPAHVHALAVKPGFKTLISQVYADDDPHLATDVQFGVREAVTGRFVQGADGGYTLDFTFRMESGESRLPRAPIK